MVQGSYLNKPIVSIVTIYNRTVIDNNAFSTEKASTCINICITIIIVMFWADANLPGY